MGDACLPVALDDVLLLVLSRADTLLGLLGMDRADGRRVGCMLSSPCTPGAALDCVWKKSTKVLVEEPSGGALRLATGDSDCCSSLLTRATRSLETNSQEQKGRQHVRGVTIDECASGAHSVKRTTHTTHRYQFTANLNEE